MTWKHFQTRVEDRPAQVLFDDRFGAEPPKGQLPSLGWLGVWCQKDPAGALWHPDEAAALDALEEVLLARADEFGHGWAVYVCRLSTAGLREYYFHFGPGAELSRVVSALQQSHPGYRVEFDATADPQWTQYSKWLAAVPRG